MYFRFAAAALVLSAAAAGQAHTLKITGVNYGGLDLIFVNDPAVGHGHDNSVNGILDGTTTLPVLYCVNLLQPLGSKLPVGPITVDIVHVDNEEAWIATNAKTILTGSKPSDIDAATQIAIWELLYPAFNASTSPTDLNDASILLKAGAGHAAGGTEYVWTQPPGEPFGQSFLTTPGPAAVAPFALGFVGLLRRRKKY